MRPKHRGLLKISFMSSIMSERQFNGSLCTFVLMFCHVIKMKILIFLSVWNKIKELKTFASLVKGKMKMNENWINISLCLWKVKFIRSISLRLCRRYCSPLVDLWFDINEVVLIQMIWAFNIAIDFFDFANEINWGDNSDDA